MKPNYDTHRFDAIVRYNAIPHDLLKNSESILDIGASDGKGQMYSKYVEIFRSSKYTGIEVFEERANEARKNGLHIIQENFLEYTSDKLYDVVMAHEIIAHIKEENWQVFFDKMMELTKPGGSIILTTIIDQDENTYDPEGLDHWQQHVTFNINLDKIKKYFPTAKEKKIRSWFHFRTLEESFIWASLRWINRIIKRHPYVSKWLLPAKENAIYIIVKE